jgi:hypothetical protein
VASQPPSVPGANIEIQALPPQQGQPTNPHRPAPSASAPKTKPWKSWRIWSAASGRFASFRSRLRRVSERLDDAWFLGIRLGDAFAFEPDTAIVAILAHYDGRTFPSVLGGISINAIVAILSTVFKSSLIFSVSAALGQLKWDWFEKAPRQLIDMWTFDEASRGPLGATKLLLGNTARSGPASIGAVITVLALAADPLVQQVVGSAQVESWVVPDPRDPNTAAWAERQTRPGYFSVG